MAWRPNDQFIEGILDNTVQGKVTGWMLFAGMDEKVMFDLDGNFHRDIRGAKIRLWGEGESADREKAARYLEGFATLQKGKVGDMTSGREPADYVNYGYFEWYSELNGRCVLELDTDRIELLSQPIPGCESDPADRKQHAENMAEYLYGVASACKIPEEHAIAAPNTAAVERARKVLANDKRRGMKLLTREIREQLPPLYSQDGKGGKTVAYVKYFTPSSNWTWFGCEIEEICDDQGNPIDYKFFGLVEGHEKELGCFVLSELEEVTGPMGLPIERDLYWKPKTLAEIAPEMFSEGS